jgi:serine protease Do
MSSLPKFASVVMSAFLICAALSPPAHAQANPFPNVIRLNTSGSFLGIEMDDVTAANMSKFKLSSERGVIVRSVVKGSPAEEAGLQEGDVILEYGGFQVWSAEQIRRLVSETPAGRKVDLVVSRDGKRVTLAAKIGSRGERTFVGRGEESPGGGMNREFRDRAFVFPRPDQRNNFPGEPAGKPRLGLTLLTLSEQYAEALGVPGKKGVLVSSVQAGSPSEGKIRAGDVIISADGKEIGDPEELVRVVGEKTEGTLALKIVRDKKQLSVNVTLPPHPAPEGRGLKL